MNGIKKALVIEASDTYLDENSIAENIRRAINTASGEIARKTPNPAATPFPPLNFINTE